MSWEIVGSLAEALGAIGALAALAYLAVQIRQNTRALRAQATLESRAIR
jgi:hypothetical protein